MGEPGAMVEGGGDLWRGMGCRQGWVGRGSGGNGVEKLEVRGGATKRGDNVTMIRRRWRRRRPEAAAAATAAGRLHADNTRSRQGEAAVSAAGTAAARSGVAAVAVAEAAVGLLP